MQSTGDNADIHVFRISSAMRNGVRPLMSSGIQTVA